MDTLSRLLALGSIRTSLDARCSLAAPWVLNEPLAESGVASYHLIVEGGASVDLSNGEHLELVSGDIVIFPHGCEHRLHSGNGEGGAASHGVPGPDLMQRKAKSGDAALTGILCGKFIFDDVGCRILLPSLPTVIVVRTASREDLASLHTLMKMLRSEVINALPGASALTMQLTSALLPLAMRAWLEEQDIPPGLFALLADRRLRLALHGMLAEPQRTWSIDELAQICSMSRATFARTFPQVAGATPAVVLADLRMAQAAIWLERDRRPIADIAEAVGYKSKAAFHRRFKRSLGMAPGEHRSASRRVMATPSD